MEEDNELNSGIIPIGDDFKSIEELNEEEILSDDLFKALFSIQDLIVRERLISRCKIQAKKLKISAASFTTIYKQYKENFIKNLKSMKSNETNFTDCEYKLKCGNWIADDSGVYKDEYTANATPIRIKASSIPIFPAERIINVDTEIEKVKLMFFKDGKWNEVIVEKNTIVSKAKIIQLANRGIEVTDENAKNLINYFSDVLELNTFVPKHGITHLGWVGEEFAPYTNEYYFDGEIQYRNIFESVKSKGSKKAWIDYVKNLRKNRTLRFIIDASFASPLVKIYNINSFIVHLWGNSGRRKNGYSNDCSKCLGKSC